MYWNWITRSRVRVGRRSTSKEIRELVFRIVAEHPTWGAPRIHGELKILGFEISERPVLRSMQRTPRQPDRAQIWKTFLANHREAIAAMDFFTVPRLTFGVLYCFSSVSNPHRVRRVSDTCASNGARVNRHYELIQFPGSPGTSRIG
jgi:putative transposase